MHFGFIHNYRCVGSQKMTKMGSFAYVALVLNIFHSLPIFLLAIMLHLLFVLCFTPLLLLAKHLFSCARENFLN